MKVFLKRLRGALGNAVFWGVAWFVIGFVVIAAERLLASGTIFFPGLIAQSVFAGFIGSITGGVFSAYVAARFRHMRVEDLKAGQFALGGALIGVLSALLMQLLGFGASIIIREDLLVLVWAMAIFGTIGGVTAIGTIKMAQRALPPMESDQQLDARSAL